MISRKVTVGVDLQGLRHPRRSRAATGYEAQETGRHSLETGTFDQFQDQRTRPLGFLDAVDGRDVRVVQRSQDFGFTLKTGEAVRISCDRFRQHLDGNLPLQVRVEGLIHLTHAALADLGGLFGRAETSAGLQRRGYGTGTRSSSS